MSLKTDPDVPENVDQPETDLMLDGERGIDPAANDESRLAFRHALGQFCTGVTAITSLTPEGEHLGITVNSFNSLSLEPPLILWSIAKITPSFSYFDQGAPFVVNVLASDQEHLAQQFAVSGSVTKFNGVTTHLGRRGVPIIDGCVAYLECDVNDRHPGGDHDIIVGRVRRIFNMRKAPLLFHGGNFRTFMSG